MKRATTTTDRRETMIFRHFLNVATGCASYLFG
jgi:hypothetical protein